MTMKKANPFQTIKQDYILLKKEMDAQRQLNDIVNDFSKKVNLLNEKMGGVIKDIEEMERIEIPSIDTINKIHETNTRQKLYRILVNVDREIIEEQLKREEIIAKENREAIRKVTERGEEYRKVIEKGEELADEALKKTKELSAFYTFRKLRKTQLEQNRLLELLGDSIEVDNTIMKTGIDLAKKNEQLAKELADKVGKCDRMSEEQKARADSAVTEWGKKAKELADKLGF
jgi:hypothetical protein